MVGQEAIIRLLLVSLFAPRTLPARRRAGPGEDAARAQPRRDARRSASSASSSRPTSCRATSSARSCSRSATASWSSNISPARSSPICSSPTKSTARRRRRSPRCSKRCRSTRSRSAANRVALPDPFLVVATQNPIEQEGTYPLPEAQLDRFMFSLHLDYPAHEEEVEIVRRTTLRCRGATRARWFRSTTSSPCSSSSSPRRSAITSSTTPCASPSATRPGQCRRRRRSRADFVEWGAGPRASQYLVLGAKALALLEGKVAAETADVREVALPVLQHRVITNYRATGAGRNRGTSSPNWCKAFRNADTSSESSTSTACNVHSGKGSQRWRGGSGG